MRARRIITIFIAFILTVGVTAMWSASTIEREGDSDANAIEDSGTLAGGSDDDSLLGEPKEFTPAGSAHG